MEHKDLPHPKTWISIKLILACLVFFFLTLLRLRATAAKVSILSTVSGSTSDLQIKVAFELQIVAAKKKVSSSNQHLWQKKKKKKV